MNLKYFDEYIKNPDGIDCRVLDVQNVDFSSSVMGRKAKETIVIRAKGNEKIDTINAKWLVETSYVTSEGNAIFYNNEKDIYVPRKKDGTPWNFDDIEEHGYEITTDLFIFNNSVAVKVKSTNIAYLLPEVIDAPTCIKDAFGVGNHQFLFEGATLKMDPNTLKVTGIEKGAFDTTWEITRNHIEKFSK